MQYQADICSSITLYSYSYMYIQLAWPGLNPISICQFSSGTQRIVHVRVCAPWCRWVHILACGWLSSQASYARPTKILNMLNQYIERIQTSGHNLCWNYQSHERDLLLILRTFRLHVGILVDIYELHYVRVYVSKLNNSRTLEPIRHLYQPASQLNCTRD